MEAIAWLETKSAGTMWEEGKPKTAGAEEALKHVLPGKNKNKNMDPKQFLAIKDKETRSQQVSQGSEEEPTQALNKGSSKQDGDVDEAEMLSDTGKSQNKELASKRAQKMVKLVQAVKKQASSNKQSSPATHLQKLQKVLEDLEKTQKQRTKVHWSLSRTLCLKLPLPSKE